LPLPRNDLAPDRFCIVIAGQEGSCMDTRDHIVAIGLLTQEDVRRLGENFSRLYPVPHDGAFDDLIKAIDEADRQRDPQPKG